MFFLTSAAAATAGPPLLSATAAATAAATATASAAATATTSTSAATMAPAREEEEEGRGPFDLVHMKYVSSIADVVAFAACLHLLEGGDGDGDGDGGGGGRLLPRRPAAVVVDGLSSLPPDEPLSSSDAPHAASFGDRRATERAVIRALATLSDATAGTWRTGRERRRERRRGSENDGDDDDDVNNSLSAAPAPPAPPLPPIALVVAEESSPDGRAPFYLYKRWLPLVLTVRPARELALAGAGGGRSGGDVSFGGTTGSLLSLSPLPAAAGGAALEAMMTTSGRQDAFPVAPAAAAPAATAAALYVFEGAGELEAVGVV